MIEELEIIAEELARLKVEKSKLDEREKALKKRAREILKFQGMESYNASAGSFYVVQKTTVSIDRKKLEKQYPEVFSEVSKRRSVTYLMFSVRGE